MSEARDLLGRPLRDLRISVTDRCNFRCRYCMPRELFGEAYRFLPHGSVLSYEEITRVARACAQLGMSKVRLTGGEPLLRRELWRLVEMLGRIEGVKQTALTTNGSRLVDEARALRNAGLSRLTVSLDALDDAVFRTMNGVGTPVDRVLRGIDAAHAAGFSPIKLNMVVQRGMNEDQIAPMVRRFSGPEFILRFIEYMDVGNSNGWRLDDVVPAAEIVERVAAVLPIEPLPCRHPGETAQRYRLGADGEMGVIASVSQPFCRDCSRLRLTADGRLLTCLFGARGHDLRALIRAGANDEALLRVLSGVWRSRDDRYSEERGIANIGRQKVEMSAIGG